MSKTAVSALHEFCAKKGHQSPVYTIIDGSDGTFICKVEVMDIEEIGEGRSKRDAKFDAAVNAIKRMRRLDPNIEVNFNEPQKKVQALCAPSNVDMIVKLRDFCVQNSHPLPEFELVEQKGTPDSPLFTYKCSVATIVRFGTAEKKKEARQKAAWEMYNVISCSPSDASKYQLCTLQDTANKAEEERYLKFKTYRELTDSNLKEVPGTKLIDRHNFFARFHQHLKDAAFAVIDDNESFQSSKEKAYALLAALKIKPKLGTQETITDEPYVTVELDCEYGVLFMNTESEIWDEIIDYFKDMLVLTE